MGDVFSNSGEKTDNVVVPTPRLQGLFLPAIDDPSAVDGFGTVVPWGGGNTTRRYADYGISIGRDTRLTTDLTKSLIPAEGGGATYNFEGLVGPQGPAGRDGIDGVVHVMGLGLPQNANYLTALPHNLDLINNLGTAADKLLYTSAFTTYYNFVWTQTSIAAISSWNEAAMNNDASALYVAADNGIYVSTDDGDTWDTYDPNSEIYSQVQCADSGGKAVVLGADSKVDGRISVTENYGVAWSEKVVTV